MRVMKDEYDFTGAERGKLYVKDAEPVISDAANLSHPDNLVDELIAIVRRSDHLPELDSRSVDEMIGYDENGLPS